MNSPASKTVADFDEKRWRELSPPTTPMTMDDPLPPVDEHLERNPPATWQRVPERDKNAPRRQVKAIGEVKTDGKLSPQRALVLVPPRVKAVTAIDVIGSTNGAIAVSHQGAIRPLRIDFVPDREKLSVDGPGWLEVRVDARGVAIERVPDAATRLDGALDPKALSAALEQARKPRKLPAGAPVDILVDADVDTQRLVDVLVAADLAGVRVIGLGNAPAAGSSEATKRGRAK
jgi:hypothetical protein